MPFSVKGTGITFQPATAFAHSSNEPVLALGNTITLDQALSNDHDIDDVVRDEKVTAAGYQGAVAPDQWFGGPALSSNSGNMILRDARGNVVDGLNYGGLVDPWAAEGYQAASGSGESGCYVPAPGMTRGFFIAPGTAITQPNRSAGRYPDGTDNDINCRDFMLQNTITLAARAEAGKNNIKVSSVTGFANGQKIFIGSGTNIEPAVIGTIGTPGATTVGNAIAEGRNVIPVATVAGFNPGQTITVDDGAKKETAVIAAVGAVRRRFGSQTTTQTDSITVTMPLKNAHAAGVQVSGSGITLATPLTRNHDNGTQVTGNLPTPGEPNQYFRKP